jgi:hypothetical protein
MQVSTSAAPGMLATEFDPAMDAVHYVGHGSSAAMLFQFGELYSFVDWGEEILFFEAASEPKKILWHTADHGSLVWKGREDWLQWLGEQLGFEHLPQPRIARIMRRGGRWNVNTLECWYVSVLGLSLFLPPERLSGPKR